MPLCTSGFRSKLQINNAKKLRHYWITSLNKCECGCADRLYILHQPICAVKLQEELNKLGYSLSKNYNKEEKDGN